MNESDVCIVEQQDRVLLIRLNRPARKNAISRAMDEKLWDIWRSFANDASTDVAIVTGTGDAFSSGVDLKTYLPTFIGATPRQILDLIPSGIGGITRGLHAIDKPIIAAVNGWALAAGFELALAADIRIASDRAQFGSFEVRRGLHHGDGGIARLVNMCGTAAALELVLGADPVDATRALALGIVSRVVPHDKLLDEAMALAKKVAGHDQAAIRSAKRTVNDMVGRNLEDQLRVEAINAYACVASGLETSERLAAFYRRQDTGRADLAARRHREAD